MKNKNASRIVRNIIVVLLCLVLVPFTAIAIAHAVIFRRYDYNSYNSRVYLTHDDIKLYESLSFVDAGWTVLSYDYTGCYNSEGFSADGYTQSVHDLDAVLTYGDEKNLSAIDGINSVTIPVLVISGTQDEYYGAESPIFAKRSTIINPACEFLYEIRENHDGHYDYFLTDAALAYQKEVDAVGFAGEIDKNLYLEHDKEFMEELNQFLLDAVKELG